MPGKSNTNQTISKKNLHRIASNTKAVNESLYESDSIFGRVIKMLGNSRISVALANTNIVQAQIRGLLRKKSTPIASRDIVILEKSDSDDYYVIGVILDRKDSNKLSKESKIPKWFLSSEIDINEASKCIELSTNTLVDENDDGYEIAYDSVEEEEEGYVKKKFDKSDKKEHRSGISGIEPENETNIDIDNI
jgi:translation initiation factor IF-1